MKKKQILALFLAATLGLGGCGKTETPVIDETGVEESRMAEQPEIRHIHLDLDEHNVIDAEVTVPAQSELPEYRLSLTDMTTEQLYAVFLPGNSEGFTQENRSTPGTLVYRKDSGAELLTDTYNCRLGFTADPEAAYNSGPESETASLLYYYTQAHPEAPAHDLSFMSAKGIQETAQNIFSQLGLAFAPELLHFVTLSGQEILDFQQEMYEDPSYTEMGSPYRLTEAEDACYLEYRFTMDGLPIYGPGDPSVSFADGVTPPFEVFASFFITAEGVRDFDMMYACTAEPEAPQKILSPEDAAQVLKEKYDQQIHFGEIRFNRVYLEYLPIQEGEGYVLKPYWCFESQEQAEWINAVTGKDISYGG